MKKQLLFLVMMILPLVASADAVEIDGIYYNLTTKGNVAEVKSNPNKYTGSIVIPETVNYNNDTYSVTSIGTSAFKGCSGLTSISIPNSVTSFGMEAFYGCSSLISVTIPNSVTAINFGTFEKCSGLTSVTIPNSVTSILGNAFSGCSSLISVTIPNSVTIIGKKVFAGCSGLTSIEVGLENTKFDSRDNCNAIIETASNTLIAGCKNTLIPNSVTSIGNGAFMNYSSLTSITIPNSVTSIGYQVFDGCAISIVVSLIENPFKITGKTAEFKAFSEYTFNNATLYVPEGTIDKYKATDGWKDFENIVEGVPAGINAIENSKNNNTIIYNLNGVRQPETKKGINIVNGKKVVVK